MVVARSSYLIAHMVKRTNDALLLAILVSILLPIPRERFWFTYNLVRYWIMRMLLYCYCRENGIDFLFCYCRENGIDFFRANKSLLKTKPISIAIFCLDTNHGEAFKSSKKLSLLSLHSLGSSYRFHSKRLKGNYSRGGRIVAIPQTLQNNSSGGRVISSPQNSARTQKCRDLL